MHPFMPPLGACKQECLISGEIRHLVRKRLFGGVADGTRTHDDQNHNLGLYQLSYSHR